MRKFMLTAALVALGAAALTAPAQSVPSRHQAEIAWGADTVEWTVPALQDGWLLAFSVSGVTNAATVAVRHLVPFDGGVLTNTVETAAAADTWHVYPTEYVAPVTSYYVTNDVILTAASAPPKPVALVPGDTLLFDLSATNTSATVVITTGVR